MILLPILLLKIVLNKDWYIFKRKYIVVILGASIQLFVLLTSNRVTTGNISNDIIVWVYSFFKLLSFGANTYYSNIASILIWGGVIYLTLINIHNKKGLNNILLLLTALLFVLAGLYSHKHSPSSIVFPGSGNRYTFIPYTLILIYIIILIKNTKILGGILVSMLSFIFYVNFQKIDTTNLEYESFAKFSEVDSVIIPIQPQWPTYPGWDIEGDKKTKNILQLHKVINLRSEILNSVDFQVNYIEDKFEIRTINENAVIKFKEHIPCPENSHVGINIFTKRNTDGWIEVFWKGTAISDTEKSIKRWYPSGHIKAQFAFQITKTNTNFSIGLMKDKGVAVISKVEVYCLK